MNEPHRVPPAPLRRPRASRYGRLGPDGVRHSRRTALRLTGVALALVLVLGGGADAFASTMLGDLPSVHDLDAAKFRGDTQIYDSGGPSGTLLADVGSNGDHRLDVTLGQISPKLIQATVAVEDKTFWTNPGFDPEGIARAALADIRHQTIVGGGSTITQQLAKQLFLTPQQTTTRKIKELALAWELTQTYSKQQILDLYLNESAYGEQQYGVEAAAESYFHQPAKDLDLARSAMLAGLPQSPTEYDPVTHLDAARARQREVLAAMVRVGDITPQESAEAAQEPLSVFPPTNTFKAPHFVNYVIKELEGLGFKPGQQQLIVTTTLDWGRQQLAEQVVRDNLNANLYRDRSGQLSSAMVAMDPRTGQLVAYVGSPDYNDSNGGQYDFVSDVPINPGSSVKPYTYAAAINARLATMDTPIADSPSPYIVPLGGGKTYQVYNYDRQSHGVQPLKVAFASSLNVPAVKTELAVKVPALVEFMRNLGLRPIGLDHTATDPPDDYGPATTLGAAPITLLQHVSGISVFADMGTYHPPESILQVTDAHGQVLYQADPERSQRQALDPGVAFIISSILADDNNRALIFGHDSPLHLADRRSAAKTGTTDSYRDGLTVGWTPDLATVVWIGDILDSSHTMIPGSDGVYVAAPAWHTFMEKALKGVPDVWYSPPADVAKGTGNDWFLADATSIPKLPDDTPSPSPTPDYGVPPDPGTGPVPLSSSHGRPSPGPSGGLAG